MTFAKSVLLLLAICCCICFSQGFLNYRKLKYSPGCNWAWINPNCIKVTCFTDGSLWWTCPDPNDKELVDECKADELFELFIGHTVYYVDPEFLEDLTNWDIPPSDFYNKI